MAGFVRMYSKEPPEIYRVGQIYTEEGTWKNFVAVGKSWDTAKWVEFIYDKDAINKMRKVFK